MNNNMTDLLTRWNSDEGKPYKGSLIDWDAYNGDDNNTNLDCMCAQGQVLHFIGGWKPEQLRAAEQDEADKATAKVLNISVAHAILLRNVNDSVDGAPGIVLTHPEKVLGEQARTVLAFWLYLDGMTDEQGDAAGNAAVDAARQATWVAAVDATRDAAMDDAARQATWGATRDAAWHATRGAAACACSEIQGAALLRERGQPFFFLPMFGFATPEEIPPLPADYGELR